MHVVVCVKQVPDTTQLLAGQVCELFTDEGLARVVNPNDFAALECALKLKDEYDARITVLSMGPSEAVQALKQCLSYGADHAVLFTDAGLANSDSFASSYALSTAIQRLSQAEPVAIVLCGRQSTDGASGQTGASIARHLGWQQITSAHAITEISLTAGTICAVRVLERGREHMRTRLPVVMAMGKDAPEIRYASLPNLLRALRYTPEIWTLADVELDQNFIGVHGSPTRVQQLIAAPQRRGGEIVLVEQVGLEAAVASGLRLIG